MVMWFRPEDVDKAKQAEEDEKKPCCGECEKADECQEECDDE